MPREKTMTFEQIYAQLEERVGKLEQGGLSLEDAIALYEEGMTLARRCQEQLDAAELKITKLKQSFAAVPAQDGGEFEPPEEIDEIEYVSAEEPPDEDDPFV
ncbi:MAG TPA: exodeoxyribonuclease VII small subunit [Dehalococcoidia bacterium]|nr:exodeoxyribonuclease VII small subunit [Dehalococcoidia bacterium]